MKIMLIIEIRALGWILRQGECHLERIYRKIRLYREYALHTHN